MMRSRGLMTSHCQMGNCCVKRVGKKKASSCVRILKENGGILEFESPKVVQDILSSFPGHRVFRRDGMSSPLGESEHLLNGQVYYLRKERPAGGAFGVPCSEAVASLRGVEVLPSPGKGMWRVKLAMDSRHLEQVLSEEVNIEALVEEMRLTARSDSNLTPNRTRRSLGLRGSSWKLTSLSCF